MKIKRRAMEALQYMDLLANKPQLYINNSSAYSTKLSWILSIISILTIIGFGLYFTIELITKTNLTVIQTSISAETPISLELEDSYYIFATSLQDPNTYDPVLNEGIYTIKAYFRRAVRNEIGNFEWFDEEWTVDKCTMEMIDWNYQKFFKMWNIDQLYCIHKWKHKLEGTFLNDMYSFIWIRFYKCNDKNPESNQEKCLPDDKINYYLKGTFLSVIFPDISINSKNYTHPNEPILSEGYTTISSTYKRELHIYFKTAQVATDTGWLFNEYQYKEYPLWDYVKEMIMHSDDPDNFCDITIKLSNRIETFFRNYTKIQTLLANVNGILKIILIIGTIITYIFNINRIECEIFSTRELKQSDKRKNTKNNSMEINCLCDSENNEHNIISNKPIPNPLWQTNKGTFTNNIDCCKIWNYNLPSQKQSHFKIEGNPKTILNRKREQRKTNFLSKKIEINYIDWYFFGFFPCIYRNNKKFAQWRLNKSMVYNILDVKTVFDSVNKVQKWMTLDTKNLNNSSIMNTDNYLTPVTKKYNESEFGNLDKNEALACSSSNNNNKLTFFKKEFLNGQNINWNKVNI